jgi:hypothetical protein
MQELNSMWSRLEMKLLKGFGGNSRLVFNMGELENDKLPRYFQAQGRAAIKLVYSLTVLSPRGTVHCE